MTTLFTICNSKSEGSHCSISLDVYNDSDRKFLLKESHVVDEDVNESKQDLCEQPSKAEETLSSVWATKQQGPKKSPAASKCRAIDPAGWIALLLLPMVAAYHLACIYIGVVPVGDCPDNQSEHAVRWRVVQGSAGLMLCILEAITFLRGTSRLSVLLFLPVCTFVNYVPFPMNIFAFTFNVNGTTNVTSLNPYDPQFCAPTLLHFVVWVDCGSLLVVCLLQQCAIGLIFHRWISQRRRDICRIVSAILCFGLFPNTVVLAVVWGVFLTPWAGEPHFLRWGWFTEFDPNPIISVQSCSVVLLSVLPSALILEKQVENAKSCCSFQLWYRVTFCIGFEIYMVLYMTRRLRGIVH